nr:FtsX-like permease family protein [Microbacterium ulmi]
MLEREDGRYVDPGTAFALASATALVAGFSGYLVVLLAGAAFSVSTRRQQHALAVASSVGAPRASLMRLVLLQGTVLGLAGGVVGAALGVAAAWPALMLLDDGRNASFWGFYVPWWGLAGIVAFAVAVGTVAALLPARAATRGDVLQALRGARRPVTLRTKRPLWGLLLIAIGVGLSATGGLILAGLRASEHPDYGSPPFVLATWAIVGGPIVFQVGVIVAGHWLLTLIARWASRFGLATRLAVRDAAANPARIVPAFAAIAACVFLASFALSAVAISGAASGRSHWWQGPEGSVVVNVWGVDELSEATEREAIAALEATDPDAVAVVRGEPSVDEYRGDGPTDERLRTTLRPERFGMADCDDPATVGPCQTAAGRLLGSSPPVAIAEDELATVLGTTPPESALRVFRDGGALVLDNRWASGTLLSDGSVTLHEWDGSDVLLGLYDTLPAPLGELTLPAVRVSTPHSLPWELIVSPATAEAIGLPTAVRTVIGAYDEPPAQETLDELDLRASIPGTSGGISSQFESGPPAPDPWLWLILGAVGALVLAAGSIALGLSRVERRPDDATLTAVGATPLLRRSIALWQALVLVGLGSVMGTIAGVIPMWGITLGLDQRDVGAASMADTPWPWLAGLAVGLPLVMAVANWLVPPRHPELTRRTAIA